MDSNYFEEYQKNSIDYIKVFDYEFMKIDLLKSKITGNEFEKLKDGIEDHYS